MDLERRGIGHINRRDKVREGYKNGESTGKHKLNQGHLWDDENILRYVVRLSDI